MWLGQYIIRCVGEQDNMKIGEYVGTFLCHLINKCKGSCINKTFGLQAARLLGRHDCNGLTYPEVAMWICEPTYEWISPSANRTRGSDSRKSLGEMWLGQYIIRWAGEQAKRKIG